jgi:hypothetical protein
MLAPWTQGSSVNYVLRQVRNAKGREIALVEQQTADAMCAAATALPASVTELAAQHQPADPLN